MRQRDTDFCDDVILFATTRSHRRDFVAWWHLSWFSDVGVAELSVRVVFHPIPFQQVTAVTVPDVDTCKGLQMLPQNLVSASSPVTPYYNNIALDGETHDGLQVLQTLVSDCPVTPYYNNT